MTNQAQTVLKMFLNFYYSGRRHRVKVSAPFLICVTFNTQASVECVVGLVTCHLNMAIWQSGAQSCMDERPHSWNVPMKKINSQRLKKSKTFTFRNLLFTKQDNILLNGNKSKIFDRVCRSTTLRWK